MNIYDIEKIIVENDFNEEDFLKFIEEKNLIVDDMTIAERISKDYEDLEEIVDIYEVIDTYIVEFFDKLKENGEFEEEGISRKHFGEICYLSLIMLRDGVHILDVIEEGILSFLQFCQKVDGNEQKIEKFARTYMLFGILNYIKKEYFERKMIFKKYIHDEKYNLHHGQKPRRILDKEKAKKFREERAKLIEEREKKLDMLEKLVENQLKYENIPYVIDDEEVILFDHYLGLYNNAKDKTKILKMLNIEDEEFIKKLGQIYLKLSLSGESIAL